MFDAVVLATSGHANDTILGLKLVERGRRVAHAAGARRVYVVDSEATTAGLAVWDRERGDAALLLVRAGDQLVHLPLVVPLLAGLNPRRIAVGPAGDYAGALWADAGHAREVIAALTLSLDSAEQNLVAGWQSAERIRHGESARHGAATAGEQRAAARMLLHEHTDANPFTTYFYRPLARPLTRALLHARLGAKLLSLLGLLVGLAGCWLTTYPSHDALIGGAVLVLIGSILGGCAGELARIQLTGSRFGAWLDLLGNELTLLAYYVAISYHMRAHDPSHWLTTSTIVGGACLLVTIYVRYFYLLVVRKHGGNYHYVGELELLDGGGTFLLRTRARPAWFRIGRLLLLYVIAREIMPVVAVVLAVLDKYATLFAVMYVGALIAAAILIAEHIVLRRQIGEIRRRGGVPILVG
jgi:phosphatidylglycerophosphate synthase